MDPTKSFVVEWVLTNGKTPGFTIKGVTWSVVDEPMTVYRGQGALRLRMRGAPDPHILRADVREVISTSTDEEAAKQYAEKDKCCLFTITLQKGVKYLDVQKTVEGIEDADVIAVIETLRGRTLTTSGKPNKCFAVNKCSTDVLVKTFRDRVVTEHEIMVLGGGVFSEVIDFKTTYSMTSGGRRRTLRSRRKRRTYRRRV
jgi:hypothetical protein